MHCVTIVMNYVILQRRRHFFNNDLQFDISDELNRQIVSRIKLTNVFERGSAS